MMSLYTRGVGSATGGTGPVSQARVSICLMRPSRWHAPGAGRDGRLAVAN
jgi:hypothetical protein